MSFDFISLLIHLKTSRPDLRDLMKHLLYNFALSFMPWLHCESKFYQSILDFNIFVPYLLCIQATGE